MNRITLERIDVKRDSRQLAVFLLLGATINIAVAWSCAFWAAPSNDMEEWDSEATRPNLGAAWVGQPEGFPERSLVGGIYPRRAGVQKSNLSSLQGDLDVLDEDIDAFLEALSTSDDFSLDLIDAGWPFASFEGGLWRHNEASVLCFDLWETKHAILVKPGSFFGYDWTIIPLMPKWLGFFANTIFFGGSIFLLFRWPRALRRHLRAKAGLCSATLACG